MASNASAVDTPPRNADSPFDPASPTPGIILRSSDNVDFYVMKTFLAFSSPVFGTMFTLPQTQNDIPSPDLPIVPVAEDSKVLRILLLHCYPLDTKDEDDDVGDIARAMLAARKYAMDSTEKRIEKVLSSKALSLLERQPLHIYALACRYGLEELGRAAAKKTLEIPPSRLCPSPELKHITGMDMYQLTEFRHRCVQEIWLWFFNRRNSHIAFVEDNPVTCAELVPFVWFDEKSHKSVSESQSGHSCSFTRTVVLRHDDWSHWRIYFPMEPEEYSEIYASPWFSTYFVELMQAIEICPSRRTVFKFCEETYYNAITAGTTSSCTLCSMDAARHLNAFREYFGGKIDEIATEVALNELEFEAP